MIGRKCHILLYIVSLVNFIFIFKLGSIDVKTYGLVPITLAICNLVCMTFVFVIIDVSRKNPIDYECVLFKKLRLFLRSLLFFSIVSFFIIFYIWYFYLNIVVGEVDNLGEAINLMIFVIPLSFFAGMIVVESFRFKDMMSGSVILKKMKETKIFEFGFLLCIFLATVGITVAYNKTDLIYNLWYFTFFYGLSLCFGFYHYIFCLDK